MDDERPSLPTESRASVARRDVPPWLVAVAVFALYGFVSADRDDFVAIVARPFVALADPSRQFLHSSPLVFGVGWVLARVLDPVQAYWTATAIGLGGLLAASLAWLGRRGRDGRRAAALVVLASPLPVVLLSWLGKGDAMLVAAYLALATWRTRPLVAALAAATMLLAHREIGVVVVLGDAILFGVSSAVVGGALAGFGLVGLYLSRVEGLTMTRLALGIAFLKPAKGGWVSDPVAHLVLGLGWTWLFVGRALSRAPDWRIPVVVALAFAAAFTTADFTRVVTLCSLPLVVRLAEGEAVAREGTSLAALRWPWILPLVQVQLMSFSVASDSHWATDLGRSPSLRHLVHGVIASLGAL